MWYDLSIYYPTGSISCMSKEKITYDNPEDLIGREIVDSTGVKYKIEEFHPKTKHRDESVSVVRLEDRQRKRFPMVLIKARCTFT